MAHIPLAFDPIPYPHESARERSVEALGLSWPPRKESGGLHMLKGCTRIFREAVLEMFARAYKPDTGFMKLDVKMFRWTV